MVIITIIILITVIIINLIKINYNKYKNDNKINNDDNNNQMILIIIMAKPTVKIIINIFNYLLILFFDNMNSIILI